MTTRTVQSKLETLLFSGKDEDFEYFAERFEARLHLLKLRRVLLDQETLAEATEANFAEEETRLQEKQFDVWCELVQCLDKRTVSLVKIAKPNGTLAWKLLNDCFKSRERPRIHQLLNKLTNLRLESQEKVRDYLIRAEELQLNLTDVGENISDQMLCSVVLKGLPSRFSSFITVFKFATEAKSFADLKRGLLNFDSDTFTKQHDQGTSSHFSRDLKCFKCGRNGHRQSECRTKVPSIVCYECGEKGHKAKTCPKKKKVQAPTQHEPVQNKRFFTKRNESNLTTEADGFSFHASNEKSDREDFDLLIDSGCTSHMIRDAKLFRELKLSKTGKVACANGSESLIEGTGKIRFLATDEMGRQEELELEHALYVPQYTKNLVSIKQLNDENFSVYMDEKPRRIIDDKTFPLKYDTNLFHQQVISLTDESNASFTGLQLWHERLGHNNKVDV